MTRHDTIIAGRGARKRHVRVERPRKCAVASAWSRERVHQVGLAAVADALGLAAMLPLGGVMTAERSRALLGRKGVRSGTGGNRGSDLEIASAINGRQGDLRAGSADGKSAPCASDPVGKIDMGQLVGNSDRLPLGPTCADALRYVDHVRGRFGAELVGGVL